MSAPADGIERLRAWTYRRQRLGSAASGPEQALRDVVGVYSSHPTAPLSLLARSSPFDRQRFAALEDQRKASRLPAMRLSVFLLPTDCMARIFAATRQPLEKYARNLRYAGLSWDDYERLKARVLDLTREPITSADLQAAIRAGAPAEETRIMTGVRLMAYEGLVLRLGANLRTDMPHYVSTEAWLGHPLEDADPDESLAWLAEAYLRAFGPARVRDFAWWSGVTQRRATVALSRVQTRGVGGGLLLPMEEERTFTSVAPLDPDALDALPKWDAYTMGLAPDGRQRLVDDAHLRSAYSQGGGGTLPGDGLPLLLRGGRAVARWSHTFAGNRLRVTLMPFPGESVAADYEHAFDAVGRLLSATSVEVTTALPSA